jgi:hypothetical protein
MSTPIVFFSYSHRDKALKNRLLTHLRISEKEGILELWDDQKIAGGNDWRPEIENAIERADVGILLISADFLTSEFILDEEIPRMLERRSRNGMRLFPIMARSCDWPTVKWLEPVQIRPSGARPLADFRGDRRDAEMATIAREIRLLLSLKRSSPTVIPGADDTVLSAAHQLPPALLDFTGRQDNIDYLRAALIERGGVGAVFGVSGIGKTALVLKLGEELSGRFSDYQIYFDLETSEGRFTSSHAMSHVIRSLRGNARLPADSVGLSALYRSTLYGQRGLLVFENVTQEQAECLISPVGSTLLITSCDEFKLPGLISCTLGEMQEDDAHALLLRIAPNIAPIANSIARFCGHPSALRSVANSLVQRQGPAFAPLMAPKTGLKSSKKGARNL